MVDWVRDTSKHMSYKHASTCCDVELVQKTIYSKPSKKGTVQDKIIDNKEFERLRGIEVQKGNWAYIPYVSFRYYCTKCDKPNNGEWEFKHEN